MGELIFVILMIGLSIWGVLYWFLKDIRDELMVKNVLIKHQIKILIKAINKLKENDNT